MELLQEGSFQFFFHDFVRDASRALAKSSTAPADANSLVLDDLTKDELDTLDEWFNHFSFKYEVVGNISDSNANLTSKPTEPVKHD